LTPSRLAVFSFVTFSFLTGPCSPLAFSIFGWLLPPPPEDRAWRFLLPHCVTGRMTFPWLSLVCFFFFFVQDGVEKACFSCVLVVGHGGFRRYVGMGCAFPPSCLAHLPPPPPPYSESLPVPVLFFFFISNFVIPVGFGYRCNQPSSRSPPCYTLILLPPLFHPTKKWFLSFPLSFCYFCAQRFQFFFLKLFLLILLGGLCVFFCPVGSFLFLFHRVVFFARCSPQTLLCTVTPPSIRFRILTNSTFLVRNNRPFLLVRVMFFGQYVSCLCRVFIVRWHTFHCLFHYVGYYLISIPHLCLSSLSQFSDLTSLIQLSLVSPGV